MLASCGREPEGAPEQAVSYSPREPGFVGAPTHEISFHMLAVDGPARFANFQSFILESGKQCDVVTSAVFKGGLDGTDEWRVRCANTGGWSVWIHSPRSIEVVRCSSAGCM